MLPTNLELHGVVRYKLGLLEFITRFLKVCKAFRDPRGNIVCSQFGWGIV